MSGPGRERQCAVDAKRRRFLGCGWRWARWCGAAVALYPLWRFAAFRLRKKPRIVTVQRSLRNGAFFLADDFALFDDGAREPWAVSRICTHLGCRLNYSEADHLLVCPCHGSRFTVQGQRIAGPAKRDLPRYAVERLADGRGYLVTLG
ncbi:MAG TPA: ubiquinol-cytochrome c reductase iron-sulfur subunit [Desulfobacterales bacterium]|nr:ubiquinol-cytochrome c reductase iron-sulfur subunit [Desulfobacterales bacterium]